MFSRCFSLSSARMNQVKALREIFESAVDAVRPAQILENNVFYKKDSETLQVFQKEFSLKNKNVYIVGAGKCVLEMAVTMENILSEKLKTGIMSVPTGILSQFSVKSDKIQFIEGAHNNLPDKESLKAAESIQTLVKSLDENSLLIVLLSGGGSALLPCPLPPTTLEEKCAIINNLSKSGADIIEMNTVRKKLSTLKGGKLIKLARCEEIICFLICDIVGNQYEFIASGPTFEDNSDWFSARDIIHKYNLADKVPDSVMNIFNTKDEPASLSSAKVDNFVLCDNSRAIAGAIEKAKCFGYKTIKLSNTVQGEISIISSNYIEIVILLIKFLNGSIDKENFHSQMKCNLLFEDFHNELKELIDDKQLKCPICLVGAGEPTVKVIGKGKGGRNQELALKFASDLQNSKKNCMELENYNIYFLSAGTDGFDGPTDAAGAISYDNMKSDAEKEAFTMDDYIKNNDSYTFLQNFKSGQYHLKIGHTNTNVMDIHLILIEKKELEYVKSLL